ncbi:MAG: hypothetical protein NTX33_13180 [Propionibacteriales bacterium]|nr:hypothetical protein [Propionibacteriales bacterium]
MTDYQRIVVATTKANDTDVASVRRRLGANALVLTAPTAEAKRVVQELRRDAVPEVVLAPVPHPHVDRGHRLDEVVRRHAVADRFRDVVVVADPATVVLLLRVLAPDQLPAGGPITEVGLPRGPRIVPLGRAAAGGVALAVLAGVLSPLLPALLLPALTVVAGLALLLLPGRRHIGQALLIAVAVAAAASLLVIASSRRFPGAW